MKKTMLNIIAAAALSLAVAPALADEEKKCTTELKDHKNLIVNLVTIPFKMVATFSHLPRCLIDHFPVNEEK